MTGPELNQLRADLGDAIGRRLSFGDMAKLCGLAPGNGADTIRKWEEGDGPSGPVAALLSVLAYASDRHAIPTEVSFAGSAGYDDIVIDDGFREMIRAEIIRRLS
jgi:hypothetical protein